MINVIDVSVYNDLVFWSTIPLGYRCLFRSSNMCGSHALRLDDLQFNVLGATVYVRTSKAYIPPERKIPCVGGWRWAMPPTTELCVGDTNMLVSKM